MKKNRVWETLNKCFGVVVGRKNFGPPNVILVRLTQGEKNGYCDYVCRLYPLWKFHVSLIIIYFLIYRTFACFFPFSLSLKFPSASLGTHVRDINARQPPGGFLLLSLIELPIYLSISNVCDRWHRIRSFEQRYIPFMMILKKYGISFFLSFHFSRDRAQSS